ncbi:MAG TPA: hypothetical protein VK502_01990 [Candidatus Saccharimonadales bacterium]|nr:hypothetical protein [Candidatus Saccharimonadales bacterium]
MTLRDLEEQKLLILPSEDSWEKEWRGEQTYYKGDMKGLALVYVNVWGKYPTDLDNTFYLKCTDGDGNYYSTEITQIDNSISRYFLSVFCIESYENDMSEIFTLDLTVKEPTAKLFKKDSIFLRDLL